MSETADQTAPVVLGRTRTRSPVTDFFVRLVREKPLGLIGGIIVLVLLVVGIFADWLAPFHYNEVHLADRLSPPSGEYLLGTDAVGRDLLSRVIYGARISMIVGLAATAISVVINVAIGMLSGYIGGKFDLIVQRFVDAWIAFPALLLILTVMAIVGGGLWQVVIVLGVRFGIGGSRIARGGVIAIKENMYVEGARALGSPTWRTLMRHILPNIMPLVIVVYATGVGGMILVEASLSFLGFGVPPPMPSWGGMLSGSGIQYMLKAPWLPLWPGLALSLAVFGVNMFGDAVRDLLDPRLRGGVGRYGRAAPKKASGR